MFCLSCKEPVNETFNFCPICGASLKENPELRQGPTEVDYDRREVSLAGYRILTNFRRATGDPSIIPKSTFAKYLKSPGTLYTLSVAKTIEGGGKVDLLFNGLFLIAGFAHSAVSEEDALERLNFALEQAIAQDKLINIVDELGEAFIFTNR